METSIVKRLEKAEKGILLRAAALVRENILSNPRIFVRHAQSILIEMQNFYYDSSTVSSEDPATFLEAGGKSALKLMEDEVRKNLSSTLQVIPRENSVTWTATLVSEEFVGLGGGDGGVPWIAFFLAGGIETDKGGEKLLWISPETANRIGWKFDGSLGRFGKGLLAVKTATLATILLKNGIDPDNLIHPISGKPGRSWFADLPMRISNDPSFNSVYVAPAIERATQEVLTKIISRLSS